MNFLLNQHKQRKVKFLNEFDFFTYSQTIFGLFYNSEIFEPKELEYLFPSPGFINYRFTFSVENSYLYNHNWVHNFILIQNLYERPIEPEILNEKQEKFKFLMGESDSKLSEFIFNIKNEIGYFIYKIKRIIKNIKRYKSIILNDDDFDYSDTINLIEVKVNSIKESLESGMGISHEGVINDYKIILTTLTFIKILNEVCPNNEFYPEFITDTDYYKEEEVNRTKFLQYFGEVIRMWY